MTIRRVDEALLRSIFARAISAAAGGSALAICASWLGASAGGCANTVGGEPAPIIHPDATTDSPTPVDATIEVEPAEVATPSESGPPVVCAEGPDAAHEIIDGAPYVDAADMTASFCDVFVRYKGCMPAVPTSAGCKFSLGECAATCGFTTSGGCYVTANNCDDSGVINGDEVVINCSKCLGGRRPEAFRERAPCSRESVVGDWFARLAEIECASIAAFRTLREELAHHRAPIELRARATAAARDEIRHTRATRRLATRFGGTARLPRLRRAPVRTLEVIAIENAIEGCVRETFGALVAAWQAEHANDFEVRTKMSQIAADELRHAALSWEVARWIEARGDAAMNARVAEARRRAITELRDETRAETPNALRTIVGLPTAAQSSTLIDSVAALVAAV